MIFDCPYCQKKLNVPDGVTEKKYRCPACHQSILFDPTIGKLIQIHKGESQVDSTSQNSEDKRSSPATEKQQSSESVLKDLISKMGGLKKQSNILSYVSLAPPACFILGGIIGAATMPAPWDIMSILIMFSLGIWTARFVHRKVDRLAPNDPRKPEFATRIWFRLCVIPPLKRSWWHWKHLVPRFFSAMLVCIICSAILVAFLNKKANFYKKIAVCLAGGGTSAGLFWWFTSSPYAGIILFGQQRRFGRDLAKYAQNPVGYAAFLSDLNPWKGGFLDGTPTAWRAMAEVSGLPDLPDKKAFEEVLTTWSDPLCPLREWWLESAPNIRSNAQDLSAGRFACSACQGIGVKREQQCCSECKGSGTVSEVNVTFEEIIPAGDGILHTVGGLEKKIQCPRCKGTGLMTVDSHCRYCSNTGSVRYLPEQAYYVAIRPKIREGLEKCLKNAKKTSLSLNLSSISHEQKKLELISSVVVAVVVSILAAVTGSWWLPLIGVLLLLLVGGTIYIAFVCTLLKGLLS